MDRFAYRYSARPLLIAGHGIRIAKAQNELFKVLERNLPVVTSFNGFDLVPSTHPCLVGKIGTVGTLGGNNAFSKCDCLICVGTRNNIRQISYNRASFAPQAAKIIVDIDQSELDKPTVQGIKVRMDAGEFLREMSSQEWSVNKDWLTELRDYDVAHPVELTPPYKFMRDLTELLPEGAVVVCGNGTACVCMYQAGIVKRGQRIFWNSGCAAMGYDLPAAIGACFANGKRDVVCVTGDGSIQMNIQELQTIKHHNLPIKIFVLNNGGYRSIEMTQANYFDGDFIGCNEESGVSFPDFARIAYTYDLPYFLLPLMNLSNVLARKGGCLCEVQIGNDYVFKPKFTSSLGGSNG